MGEPKEKDKETEPAQEPEKVEKDTGEKVDGAGDHDYICVSAAGVVVPTKEGGTKAMKRGDSVEGEYYDQVAERLNGLVLKSSLDRKFLDKLERERKIRTGEAFPQDFKRAAEGVNPDDYDPRLDGGGVDASENLSRVVQESRGAARRRK
jgi:hypothetical protein